MKLTRVEIQNFRNIGHAELDLSAGNFLIGLNEEGKSSVLAAIQFALFGWCEHTDRRGAGFGALISDGAESAGVWVTLDNGYIVSVELGKKRTFTALDTNTGEILENITSPAGLWHHLGIPLDHATLCAFPNAVVNSNELSDVLTGYLSKAVTPALLADTVINKHKKYLLALANKKQIELSSVNSYQHLGQMAYDRRRDLRRDLKRAEAVVEDYGFVKPVEAPAGDAAALEQRIRSLNRDLGRAEAAEAAPAVDSAAIEAEIQRVGEEARTHRAALEIQEQYKSAEAQAEAAAVAVTQAEHELSEAKNAAPAACPTCGKKLTAKQREKYVADAVAEAERVVAAARAHQTETSQHAADLEKRLPDYDAQAAVNDAQQRLADLRAQLSQATPPYDGPSGATLQDRITAAETELSEVRTQAEAHRQYAELQDAKRHVEALSEELEHLQWIVKQYHDGKALKNLMHVVAGPLERRINAALHTGDVSIQPDGKRFVMVCDGRPLSRASRGRKALVAYAFATAFADSGAPVLLDDVNDLDPLNRRAVMAMLRDTRDRTVVMAGTPLQSQPPLDEMRAALAPAKVFYVEDGRVNP